MPVAGVSGQDQSQTQVENMPTWGGELPWKEHRQLGPDEEKVTDLASNSIDDIATFASSENSDALAEAIFDVLPEAGTTEADDADTVMDALSNIGTGPDFKIPSVVIVREGEEDINYLPDNVLGAFVPGENGEPGTIMIAEKMLDPATAPEGETLESLVLEEVGEAVAFFVTDILEDLGSNLSVADGLDIGDRIQTVIEAEDPSNVEFEDDDNAMVDVLVRLRMEEDIAAKAAAETMSVEPDDPNSGDYATSQLTDDQLEFYTAQVWDETGVADTGNVWAGTLVAALNGIGPDTSPVNINEKNDLLIIADPSKIDSTSPNAEKSGQFTRDEVKALIQSGAIQFSVTEMGTAATDAHVDVSKMDMYIPPSDTTSGGYGLADIVMNHYLSDTGILSKANFASFMTEFFGLDLDSISSKDDSGVTDIADGARTLDRVFRAYVSENGGSTLDGRGYYPEPNVEMLRNFLGDDTQSANSILIAKDSISKASGFNWANIDDAGGTVDPDDESGNPQGNADTPYSAEDIQQPDHPFFEPAGSTDDWVDSMNDQAVVYSGTVMEYQTAIEGLSTQVALPTSSPEDAIAAYEVFIEKTIDQLQLIESKAGDAGLASTNIQAINGVTYEEPTFVSEDVRSSMTSAMSAMQTKAKALVTSLTSASKQLADVMEANHGAIVDARQAAQIDMIMTGLQMLMDFSAIGYGIGAKANGQLKSVQSKATAKLGKLPDDKKAKIETFRDETLGSANFNNVSREEKVAALDAFALGEVYSSSTEEGANILEWMMIGVGTLSTTAGEFHLMTKRIAVLMDVWAEENPDAELPTYMLDMLEQMSGTTPDSALNFYDDLGAAGFETELDGIASAYSVASTGAEWAANDVTAISVLQTLNSTGGNRQSFFEDYDGFGAPLEVDLFAMTEETSLLREMGYSVSRGGKTLSNYVQDAPFEDDPDYSNPNDWYIEKVGWLEDYMAEGGDEAFKSIYESGWMRTSDVTEWGSRDNNLDNAFKVADGNERIGFVKFGNTDSGGISYESEGLQNLRRNDDTALEAEAALYEAVGVDPTSMTFDSEAG